MVFSREFIQNLPEDEFSEREKRHLERKFFPPPSKPPWQKHLRAGWEENKRWHGILDAPPEHAEREPYRITPAELLRRAKARPPKKTGNTVSTFTSWIYSLYQSRARSSSLEQGKQLERRLAHLDRPKPPKAVWDLLYVGYGKEAQPSKSISSLLVEGKSLWGKPDIVFRERATGRILIVELKWSRATLPSDCWPNVRAQLWAYSKIDDFSDAPEIILACEAWGMGIDGLKPRGWWRWHARRERWERYHEALFSYFGGETVS